MADTIACPECGRALRLPEDLIGQEVRCPSCQAIFVAERPAPPLPTYTVREQPVPPRRRSDDHDLNRLPRRPARAPGEDYRVPHRGTLVLTLGILSIALACCPLTGWILGGIAIARANEDLREMARGEMDRAGRGLTQAGKVCAVFGVVLATLAFFYHVLLKINGF
jgi:hypothetical protein